MTTSLAPSPARRRAPSKRALATRKRVLDAAEAVFAAKGFDGATIREIAARAGEPVGTIHHHGGGKEQLFRKTVERRAAILSEHRAAALNDVRKDGPLTVEAVLTAFFQPFLELAGQDPGWRNYARLVAFVSSDAQWRSLASDCFDPTFDIFLQALIDLQPEASRQQLAARFVFCVSALIAHLTSQDRIGRIAGGHLPRQDALQNLIGFCAGGMALSRAVRVS